MKTARQKRAALVRVAVDRAKVDPKFRRRLVARLRGGKAIHKLVEKAENQGALHEFALHDALRALAENRGLSVSALVREVLTEHLSNTPDKVRRRLDEIAGVAEGPPDLGSKHDSYLYGSPPKTPVKKSSKRSKSARKKN